MEGQGRRGVRTLKKELLICNCTLMEYSFVHALLFNNTITIIYGVIALNSIGWQN